MAVDLIIFDCDGVLADSEVISSAVLIDELAAVGISVDADYVRRHFLGRSFPTVARTIRESLSDTLPADFEMRYRSALLQRFESELRPTPGVHEMLARLPCPICVATSSSPPRVARTIELLGMGRYFGQNVFTASQVERGKPAPDIFLFAAARMGAAPARTLVIEDSAPGLIAGHAAGMQILAFTGGAHLAGTVPVTPFDVRAFSDWSEFAALLGDLSGAPGAAPAARAGSPPRL